MDVDRDDGSIALLLGDILNLDGPLESVDLDNLALATLGSATDNGNLVVLVNGEGADLVLFTELLGQRSRQNDTSHMGRSSEVGLASLAARARDSCEKRS